MLEFGFMMNLITIYGIYGDEKGIEIYKYFDFHALLASFIAQFLIAYFGSHYIAAMLFFSVINFGALVILPRIAFPTSTTSVAER